MENSPHELLSYKESGEKLIEDVENYRQICDTYTIGSRKSGLLDEMSYVMAVNDPNSSVVKIRGCEVPVFSSIDYAVGYDKDRCIGIVQNITNDVDPAVQILSVPLSVADDLGEIGGSVLLQENSKSKIFVFAEVNMLERDYSLESMKKLAKLVRPDKEPDVTEVELIEEDHTINKYGEASRHPDMRLFEVRVDPIEGERKQTLVEAREEFINNADQSRPTKVIRGVDLDKNPELLEKMWKIYEDRFEWLAGGVMPILLEDKWEDFYKSMTLDSTTVIADFKDGEVTSFMYFTEKPSTTCFWLNEKFFNARKYSERGLATNLFFPGIVAKKDGSLGNMRRLVSTASELLALTGQPAALTFESTNISSAYIPKSLVHYIHNASLFKANMPEMIDEHYYTLYEINYRDSSDA